MPSVRDRNEISVDRVRIAGVRSEDGGRGPVEDVEGTEIVVQVDTREYGFRADRTLEVSVDVMIDSDRSLRRRYAEAVSSKRAPSEVAPLVSLFLGPWLTAGEVLEATSATDIEPATFLPPSRLCRTRS